MGGLMGPPTGALQIPTGNTTEVVKEYYNYLYSTYLLAIPTDRATHILWNSVSNVYAWAFALILFFYLYAHLMRVHRSHGELYGSTSFAGSILERNGKVDVFTWVVIISLFLAAFYYAIKFMLVGYLY